jgi:hypothetical protein
MKSDIKEHASQSFPCFFECTNIQVIKFMEATIIFYYFFNTFHTENITLRENSPNSYHHYAAAENKTDTITEKKNKINTLYI